jgi:hypothetical protein
MVYNEYLMETSLREQDPEIADIMARTSAALVVPLSIMS